MNSKLSVFSLSKISNIPFKYCIVFMVIYFLFNAYFISGQTGRPDALALYRRGLELDRIGRNEEASASYSEAVNICKNELSANPKNMEAYVVFTWSLFRLKQYSETIKYCNIALKIANDPRIIETAGEAYFFLRNYKESLKHIERYIDMAPTGERISVAHFYAAEIYRLSKKFNKADISYSIALYKNPSNALWWFRLGLTREQAGDTENALTAFSMAVKNRPNYKEAQEGITRLSR